MKTTEILEKVAAERARQDSKWGYPQKNTLPEWGIILGEEVGEAMKELNELHFRQPALPSLAPGCLITELIQTAAVAVSIVEHLTEYGIAVDDRHPVVFEDRFDTDADQVPEDDETVDEVVTRQNIYYRTEDRLPTREDADDGEELLVSEDRRYWYLAHYMKVKDSKYLFWAPVPKVEVPQP